MQLTIYEFETDFSFFWVIQNWWYSESISHTKMMENIILIGHPLTSYPSETPIFQGTMRVLRLWKWIMEIRFKMKLGKRIFPHVLLVSAYPVTRNKTSLLFRKSKSSSLTTNVKLLQPWAFFLLQRTFVCNNFLWGPNKN